MKTRTRKNLEARTAQAVRFVRGALGDGDKARDIEDEFLEDYAEHRHIKLTNPKGATHVAEPTRQELLDRIEDLETENEDLQSQLDQIREIIGDENEVEDTDTGEDEDDDQGEG